MYLPNFEMFSFLLSAFNFIFFCILCLTCTSFDDTKGEILVRIVFEKKTCSANLVFMKSLHEDKKGNFGRRGGEWGNVYFVTIFTLSVKLMLVQEESGLREGEKAGGRRESGLEEEENNSQLGY